ncbi:undecaprenyl-diphosphate phosphatase [Desulfospira joergensenii]|uniref:undecaprenyl-diphosphate phosphatase n=1 Tax=Desulfospira joergensenii TaxID=53329 RepID=UPI0003B749E1|nr:undecaprenyl-diphosphate phosphatase [Desulfospira joergensenii]
MEIYQGIILGILQGLTEFLPVSSSGHLVLGQLYLGIKESMLSFDISVHMGTLAAVLVVYFSDIRTMVRSMAGFTVRLLRRQPAFHLLKEDPNLKMAWLIIIGSVPTALIGLALKKVEHILFTSSLIVGFMLILTGTVLWVSRHFYHDPGAHDSRFDAKRALFIGIIQGLAVIPGISRSGSTIAAGMFAGFDRSMAAKFSFLLSIPAILGAQILSIKETLNTTGLSIDPVTVCGTIASFLTGLGALTLLLKLVHRGKFHLFAPYCWLAGTLALAANLI